MLAGAGNMLQLGAQRSTAAQPRNPRNADTVELDAARNVTSGLHRRHEAQLGG
jgi:hypothetical protein